MTTTNTTTLDTTPEDLAGLLEDMHSRINTMLGLASQLHAHMSDGVYLEHEALDEILGDFSREAELLRRAVGCISAVDFGGDDLGTVLGTAKAVRQ